MNTRLLDRTSKSKSPLLFFALAFALSSPFWLAGAATGRELLPGVPVSGLMVVCPAIAAAILAYRANKTAGVRALLKRSFDYKRIRAKIWYVPIVLLMPGVMVLTDVLRRLMGLPLPAAPFPGLAVLGMLVVFFVVALGEELGWMGYAMDPLQDRWNALGAGIGLGLVWAAWHIVPLVQGHRSLEWIAWWALFTVASRVLYVWLYNNTGKSVFAMALYHDISNVSTVGFADYFDPRLTSLIVTVAAVIVIVVWGPKTLARYRYARSHTDLQVGAAN